MALRAVMRTVQHESGYSQWKQVVSIAPARPGVSIGRVAYDETALSWYALRTRANHEFIARDQLRALEIPEFLPFYSRISNWSDRRKTLSRPLFPGYLFAQVDARDPSPIRRAAAVVQVIGLRAGDGAIDGDVIENLMRATADPSRVEPAEYPAPDFIRGEFVTITRGPLAGLRGVIERTKTARRLIVAVDILARACAVELRERDVLKAA
jgi:transcription antitermination factor NusG